MSFFLCLWQSKSLSFVEKAVQLWDYWLIITMVWKLFNESSTESCAGWYILFLVWRLIWSPSGHFLYLPLFFAISISDLPEVVLRGSTIALYADDCKCSRIINTAGDLELFQQDLDNLPQWSVRNFMNFNAKKYKIMKIT